MKFVRRKIPALARIDRISKAGQALVLAALMAASGLFAQTSDLVSRDVLRVCADPANLPQSHEDGSGYENEIAELIAAKMGIGLEYFWFPMSTGFVRNSLAADRCDVIIGYSAGHELVLNTNPYLVSTYILLTAPGSDLASVEALKDEKLQARRIGVIAGGAPATHLAKYGLAGQMAPYHLFTDRRHHSPAEEMLADLAAGKIDAAILWGPIGGPLLKAQYPDFKATPLLKEEGKPDLFARITMGVRHTEISWKHELNDIVMGLEDEIDAILKDAGVPLLDIDGKNLKAE